MPYYTILDVPFKFGDTVRENFKWRHALMISAFLCVLGLLTISGTVAYVNEALWAQVDGITRVSAVGALAPSVHRDAGVTATQQHYASLEPTYDARTVDEFDSEAAITTDKSLFTQSMLLLAAVFAGYGIHKGVSWSMGSVSASAHSEDYGSKNDASLNAAAAADSSTGDSLLPSPSERKKIVPLALMFFCILFNYTILRDTKDVLMVTAPKSGAEVIPFLKTYVNLPGAILFTVIYSKMSNAMPQSQVFYTLISVFLAFFTAFSFILYPNQAFLHPHVAADKLAALLPISFAAPISIFRNWTYALFYLMAEMWGSVVVSILFWGLANQICTVGEAKKFYPLFGLGANVALIFSGQYVKIVSKMRDNLPAGVDPWGFSLKLLVVGILFSGAVLTACYTYIQRKVITDPNCVDPNKQRQSKQKTKLTMKESAEFLMKSTYIRDLALLVICYGMSINIVEVTWKSKLKAQFPDPNSYSAFMGNFSSATGTVTLVMMLLGRQIFERFGWGVAASITPITLGVTGALFFSLILAPGFWNPITAAAGTTPLMLAVLIGAFQNIMSKSAKYSLFDPCKEMAYIPLDAESRTKGKAAVDVIGNPLGKSGGSFVQQALIFGLGSLAVSTPYLGIILALIIAGWLFAARSLNSQFEKVNSTTE